MGAVRGSHRGLSHSSCLRGYGFCRSRDYASSVVANRVYDNSLSRLQNDLLCLHPEYSGSCRLKSCCAVRAQRFHFNLSQ